ncbi:hypothetical protein C5748_27050 [Phyllobacterium phragmitis]|uniref:Uncharacterized protein n=1 Tax=Phyllobacterium phragmitis TaxID=2670329 RepID=A0A2S9IIT3_9HYPH|nr:hypothetical protein [Phyllobacterium phragmitis]PRD40436.1 hypothetical protein C5748_27050 [Phyllobacterium phragmitis]
MTKSKQTKKPKPQEAGFEGARIYRTKVRITSSRSEARSVRSRPGTFEWRYGRKSADAALYHAGSHFAVLWERAGTADAKSPNLMGSNSTGWRGLPDARCDAMSEIGAAVVDLGKLVSSRLTDYCVHGLTAAEIARKYDQKERDMAPVLHQDLRACAIFFRYL